LTTGLHKAGAHIRSGKKTELISPLPNTEREMISTKIHQVLSLSLCAILLVQPVTAQTSLQPSSVAAPAVAPLTADQLNALVAPIALYPDALVAQVLAAASYPDQVAFADDWLSQNQNLQGTALTQQVDQQSWDPSVKALTQFPSVLHDLAKNLSWTSSLGQAFTNQQSDVMAAVQVMRARAQAAGTLQSSPQIKVVQQGAQTIVIQPADASVVYVPQYNPAVVYGAPIIVPAYTPPVVVAAGVSFGAGVAIGAAFGGGGFVGGGFGGGAAWGFGAWGCNWGGGGGGGNINYNHNTYINRTVINRTVINRNTNNTANNWNNGSRPGEPNGGRNGDHGLIGGNGGIQHQPDGGRNGDHGLIGGNGGIQHQPGVGDRGNTFNDQRTRSAMSGNGEQARTEANRGRASMRPATLQRGGQQRSPQQRFGQQRFGQQRSPQQRFGQQRGGQQRVGQQRGGGERGGGRGRG
jgi:hypothetical protein